MSQFLDFKNIHEMLAAKKYKTVLSNLIDPGTGRLRHAYADDPNHAWYCVGDAEFKLGNFKNAIKAFQKAGNADSDDLESMMALGNCYDALKRPKLAERVLRKALDRHPEGRLKASLSVNLANALLDQKKYLEATEFYLPLLKRRDEIGRVARTNNKRAAIFLESL